MTACRLLTITVPLLPKEDGVWLTVGDIRALLAFADEHGVADDEDLEIDFNQWDAPEAIGLTVCLGDAP